MFYIFIYLFLFVANPCFAGQPSSGLDKEPSVDTAASAISPEPPSSKLEDEEASVTQDASDETAASYVYDLKKLIIKSRENIKRVNEKIKEQTVIKRNQKREERAREYYEHGLQLQDEGKFNEAREYFEKAIAITDHPEMLKYIDQSATKLKAQEAALRSQEKQQMRIESQEKQAKLLDAATAYNQAVAYFKEKKFKEAKDMFNHVQELSENYKGTQSYLRIIDQNILESEATSSKQNSKEVQRQQAEAEKAREREKETWRKEIEKKEKDRKTQINAQADSVYAEAVTLYKNKKFMEAKKKFGEVEWVVPDYKATRDYLARADKDMAAEQARIDQIKAKELAMQQWEEEVARRKKEALEKKEAEEKEKQRIKQLEDQVSFVYQAAVNLFDKKSYDEALEKFNDIEKTLSGYKSTKAFIAKITYIKEKEKQQKEQIVAQEARRKALEEERIKAQEQKSRDSQVKREIQDKAMKEQISSQSVVPSAPKTKEEEIDEAKLIEALSKQSASVMAKINALAEDKRMAPVKRTMVKVDDALNRIKMQKESILRELRAQEEAERQRQLKIEREQRLAAVKDDYDEAIMLLRNQNYESAMPIFVRIENDMPNYKMTRWFLAHIKEDAAQAERQAVLERTHKEEDRIKELEAKRERELMAQRVAEQERRKAEAERRRQLRVAQESEVQALADKAVNLNDEILEVSRRKDFQMAKAKFTELEKVLETLEALKRTMAMEDVQEQESQIKVIKVVKEIKETKEPKPTKEIKVIKDVKVVKEIKKIKPSVDVEEQLLARRIKAQTKSEAMVVDQRKEKLAEIKAKKKEYEDQERRNRAQRLAEERAKREEQDYAQDAAKRQKEEVFDHAVSLYKQRKFTAAKVIFDDLALQNYPGAKAYIKNIDKYYEKAAARSDAASEKERSEFIGEQIRKQKMANVLAQKERAHQRELTAQLERQRRLAQEAEQKQRIQIESMKLKERERERIQRQRLKEQAKRKKEEEDLQFRKIPAAIRQEPAVKEEPVKPIEPITMEVPEPKQEAVVTTPVVEAVVQKAEVVTQDDRQKQKEFSDKRKKYFEEQQSKEEKAKAEEAKKLAAKEAIEKRKKELEEQKKKAEEDKKKAIEDRAKEVERKKQELVDRKKKQEQERLAELERKKKELEDRQKRDEQRRAQILKDKERQQQEKLEEQRRKDEIKRQQEEALKERQRREELERQAREHQKQLDEERRVIQQKLNDSASAIYDEAMRLYAQANYQAAYNKFKDLQDVLPDFKQTQKYMTQAQMFLNQPAPVAVNATTSQPTTSKQSSVASQDTPAPVDREQAIKKTLEVFDLPSNGN